MATESKLERAKKLQRLLGESASDLMTLMALHRALGERLRIALLVAESEDARDELDQAGAGDAEDSEKEPEVCPNCKEGLEPGESHVDGFDAVDEEIYRCKPWGMPLAKSARVHSQLNNLTRGMIGRALSQPSLSSSCRAPATGTPRAPVPTPPPVLVGQGSYARPWPATSPTIDVEG